MEPTTKKEAATYSLKNIRATPFPNRLLDAVLTLPETQARIVCAVVRLTLGWHGGARHERKASVSLTYRDLLSSIGRHSPTIISRAVEALVSRGIVEVSTEQGQILKTPAERRRYCRPLSYRIARAFVEQSPEERAVDNSGDKEHQGE